MKLADVLQGIYDTEGVLTPLQVVEHAIEPDSPLHPYFEWDDTIAGHRFRLEQAGGLIRRCRIDVIISPESSVRVRKFSPVPHGDAGQYMPTDEALSGASRDVVLQQARRELDALRRKYSALIDFDALLQSLLAKAA